MQRKKNISRLDFDIGNSINKLQEIEKEMEKLSTVSDTVFKNIENNFSKGLTTSNIKINSSQIKNLSDGTLNYIKKREADLTLFKEKEAIKQANNIKKQNEQVIKSSQTMYDKILNYAKTYLIYQGFNELKQAASELITEMVNVESQMVQIDRVLNDSSLNIINYRDELIQLAYDYANSFENVADITLRLAQAGFDAQQSIKLTESTLLALNTAELNATEATDDMVAVMAQWGLMQGSANEVAKDYSEIIDKINRTADQFPTTSADILDALKKTSSAFNLAGASIDETIASIVAAETVSQRGGKAIGTALNNIINQLKDQGRIDIAESLGISFYKDEAKTEFKDIMDILGELSDKMQELKNAGKESSVEMQNLLSVFTIFRRNIGSSLLGEMGEGGTYQEVLDLVQATDTLGYSMSENAKYMATAKAAQEQFNAELLKLKTAVWDGGVEDVFRSMLLLGSDVIKILTTLTETFGSIPVTIAIVTLAFSTLKKNLQATNLQIDTTNKKTVSITSNSKLMTSAVNKLNAAMKAGTISTNGLKVATIALNAVYSVGLSLAITTVFTALEYLINKQQKAIEKSEEIISKNKEEIESNKEKAESITNIIDNYEKYSNIIGPLTDTQQDEFENSQKSITKYLIEQNKYTAEMKGNYELQLKTLKEIRKEQYEINVEKAKENLIESQSKAQKVSETIYLGKSRMSSLKKEGISFDNYLDILGITTDRDSNIWAKYFNSIGIENQIKLLEEWKEQLEETGKYGSKSWNWINETLDKARSETEDLTEAQNEYNNIIAEQKVFNLSNNIQTIEDYKNALESIKDIKPPTEWTGTTEDFRAILEQLISEKFPEFNKQLQATAEGMTNIDSAFSTVKSSLETLDTITEKYTELSNAADEFNQQGYLSSSTLQSLINNNLLQYLDASSGKIKINTQVLEEQAVQFRNNGIEALAAAAQQDIYALAEGRVSDLSYTAQAALETLSKNTVNAGNSAQNSTPKLINLASSIDAVIKASQGKLGEGVNVNTYLKQAEAIKNSYVNIGKSLYQTLPSMAKSAAKSSSSASKSATDAFEQQSQERIKIYKEEISEYEELEQEWVDKYKTLGLLSTNDLKYIQQQRINRYKQYLEQIKNLTGITEEDRASLIREYSTQVQKAELEYFNLVKDKLNEQIEQLKEANEERINGIKEAADAQIEALQKVEDENDRIRQKEEYERKRQELISGYQGIEYWEQRTGREAQLALAEAKKKLEELDNDWKEKQEEWTLEDQIAEIESARDAQIKAIEDAQETQIVAWEAAYQKQIDLYAQTGQIIYDDSVIQAGYLYDAYVDNFIEPFGAKLQSIVTSVNLANAATAAAAEVAAGAAAGAAGAAAEASAAAAEAEAAAQSAQQAYERLQRTLSNARTLSDILFTNISNAISQGASSKPYGQEIQSIANDYANRLSAQIGKFHDGGKVGTNTEALAIVKPNEVILKPEWAAGLDKLIAKVNAGDNVVNNSNSNTTNIDVDGNLVNIEAKINNKRDMDDLTKKIEKVLKDKFNIKK